MLEKPLEELAVEDGVVVDVEVGAKKVVTVKLD